MNFYTSLLRPLLFRLNPETAHRLTVAVCRWSHRIPGLPSLLRKSLTFSAPSLRSTIAGQTFENPVGLAAGWDKNGHAVQMLDSLGIGFAEIGSVSNSPSPGNPRPRLFRLPLDQAIVVNYGLPNEGAAVIARRLSQSQCRIPLGVNIVKTNFGVGCPACSAAEIIDDYVQSAAKLHALADYLMLNLSCPNAEGGQDFFSRPGNIARLLRELAALELACPIFLKVVPDPSPAAIERLIAESIEFEFLAGFMFNLPSGKPESIKLNTPREIWGKLPGAVSGKPVESLIEHCIQRLYLTMPPNRFHIIAAGGIFTADDAYRKIRLGASLVQLYTALVYEGPWVVRRINQGLLQLLSRDGFNHISEAVGVVHKMG